MHILLTDVLTCPQCGPDFGLILLADHVQNRRVLEGTLGCPGCRAQYAVRRGAAYCGAEPVPPGAVAASDEAAIRLAALIGVTGSSRYALLAGPAAAQAPAVAALFDGLEVIAVGERDADTGGTPAAAADVPGVNPLGIGSRLPLATGRIAGVALTGRFAAALLEEGARVLSPAGRLLLDPAPPDADPRLAAAGMRVLARDATAVVAAHA